MAQETQVKETQQQGAEGSQDQEHKETEDDITNDKVRNTKLFKQVTSELKAAKEFIEATKAEKEKMAKEAEMKKSEEAGEYKKLREQLIAEAEKAKSDLENYKVTSELKYRLSLAGADNEIFINGSIASFKGKFEDIESYVTTISTDEKNASYFGKAKQPASTPQSRSIPGSRAKGTLEERAKLGDKEAIREVFNRVLAGQ